jgi:hypothetical protein
MSKTPVPGEVIPSESVIVAQDLTPDDSQVRDRVTAPTSARAPMAAGPRTEALAAVIGKRLERTPEHSLQIAKDVRAANPEFTAHDYNAKASRRDAGRPPTTALPALVVTTSTILPSKRRILWPSIIGALILIASILAFARLASGSWPWNW